MPLSHLSKIGFHKLFWTALIAMLALKFLQLKSKLAWSLSNLVAMLRWNLFTYRDLWIWLDEPFDTPPLMPSFPQLVLSWTANDG